MIQKKVHNYYTFISKWKFITISEFNYKPTGSREVCIYFQNMFFVDKDGRLPGEYQITLRNILKDGHLQTCHCENLKSQLHYLWFLFYWTWFSFTKYADLLLTEFIRAKMALKRHISCFQQSWSTLVTTLHTGTNIFSFYKM